MCLLDPGLDNLRAQWSPELYAELRITALQALVCALPRIPARLAKDYSLIRRFVLHGWRFPAISFQIKLSTTVDVDG